MMFQYTCGLKTRERVEDLGVLSEKIRVLLNEMEPVFKDVSSDSIEHFIHKYKSKECLEELYERLNLLDERLSEFLMIANGDN